MSWFFGSSKKKEPPPVTVDPTPIENEYYMVPNQVQTSSNLYPNLNGGYPIAPLPYSLAPHPSMPSASDDTSAASVTPQPKSKEPVNQLESIPFRIAPSLQAEITSVSDVSLDEFTKSLNRVKEFFNSAEFDYDFDLEKRIMREAKMVNGNTAY